MSIPRHWSLRIKNGLKAKLIAKLEYFNPAGSVKDRSAKATLDVAEEKGMIYTRSVIIEPTSGNTDIGLVSVAAARGYRVIVTMSETICFSQAYPLIFIWLRLTFTIKNNILNAM